MPASDHLQDDPLFEAGAESEGWRAPARCPECQGVQTRFVRMEHEFSVYACESCGIEFEQED